MSNDECHTPDEFYQKLNLVFDFKLDAAATKKNTKCRRFFTKKDNALTKQWKTKGWVWLNPPFSREAGGITKWLNKAFDEVLWGNARGVVCLVICDVSTAGRQLAWDQANEIVELSPRINFESPGKKNRKGGLQSYQLVIFDSEHTGSDLIMSRWNWKDKPFEKRSKLMCRRM